MSRKSWCSTKECNIKKLLAVAAGLLLVVGLASCSAKADIYGTYTFDKVSFISPVSSLTADYLNEKLQGTEFSIEQDEFSIAFADAQIKIASPTYTKEEIPTDQDVLSDASCVIGNEIEYQYTIYNEDGDFTGWRLYASKDTLWISSYVEDFSERGEITLFIYKLKPN